MYQGTGGKPKGTGGGQGNQKDWEDPGPRGPEEDVRGDLSAHLFLNAFGDSVRIGIGDKF